MGQAGICTVGFGGTADGSFWEQSGSDNFINPPKVDIWCKHKITQNEIEQAHQYFAGYDDGDSDAAPMNQSERRDDAGQRPRR
ncbi:MAG: hypothetical protein ACLR2G_11190 [Phascolarctobacterium faecium]